MIAIDFNSPVFNIQSICIIQNTQIIYLNSHCLVTLKSVTFNYFTSMAVSASDNYSSLILRLYILSRKSFTEFQNYKFAKSGTT